MKRLRMMLMLAMLGSLALVPGGMLAGHEGVCHEQRYTISPASSSLPHQGIYQLSVEVNSPAIVTGAVVISDEHSRSVFLARRSNGTLRCGVDQSGHQVFEEFAVSLLEARSGRLVDMQITPLEQPAPVPGTFGVLVVVDDLELTHEMTMRAFGPDLDRRSPAIR